MKKPNTKHHKAGSTWNEMNRTDRANWLRTSGAGHSGWANDSWWNLVDSIRSAFIAHVEAMASIYSYR